MNKTFHKPLGALEIDVISLYGFFTVGATGACTLGTTGNKGIASVVRNSAGKYTITLSEACQAFLWGDAQLLDSANSDPVTVGVLPRLFSQAVDNATPTFVIQFFNYTNGAAADPASGSTVYFKLELRNSTVS